MQRMSNRKYLSMSIERQYNLPVDPSAFLQSDSRTSSDFGRELAMGAEAFEFLLGYLTHPNDAREPAESFSSAFEAGTPGIMLLEEVEQEVDLGRWQLRLRGMEVFLEVRITWELGTRPLDSLRGFMTNDAARRSIRISLTGTRVISRSRTRSNVWWRSWRPASVRTWSGKRCLNCGQTS